METTAKGRGNTRSIPIFGTDIASLAREASRSAPGAPVGSGDASGDKSSDGTEEIQPFDVSLSAEQTFLRCPARYKYRYVDKLRSKMRQLAPERGTIFHDKYLGTFAQCLKDGEKGPIAHERALEAVEAGRDECDSFAVAAMETGAEGVAHDFAELTDVVLRIAGRYYKVRGANDAIRYQPLMVEQPIEMMVAKDIRSRGRIDLLAYDREEGKIVLVENKTTKDIPPEGFRMRDLQTLLYSEKIDAHLRSGVGIWAEALADFTHPRVEGLLWNYLWMKEPTVPEPLQKGGVSRDKKIVTTWEVYAQAVRDCGDDPDAPIYDGMRELLAGAEEKRFFPRFHKDIRISRSVAMDGYTMTARRMQKTVNHWRIVALNHGKKPGLGDGVPVERVLVKDCEWDCDFKALCVAELIGGDADQVALLKYRRVVGE